MFQIIDAFPELTIGFKVVVRHSSVVPIDWLPNSKLQGEIRLPQGFPYGHSQQWVSSIDDISLCLEQAAAHKACDTSRTLQLLRLPEMFPSSTAMFVLLVHISHFNSDVSDVGGMQYCKRKMHHMQSHIKPWPHIWIRALASCVTFKQASRRLQ